ncbi:Hsp70 family chaperone [Pochonia chlamydosporia 170]|uniref:Hsp70 family chaperone n=1 Tax=Pochonia chlamydosporia 170 TaxID=1380566 RepID=A0A179G605_METCM|nr:Hsp70 family chaperone [Pochonia chlamydosporia 170]OAQ73256.1 Hsp70 family chaperone [Pochonia chlamydosporia 170]
MATSRPSPLMMLLGALFFFSANVFAAGAVLGVDLGTEYIKAALVKPGIPLEIVLTKDSRRKETSAVAFKPSKSGPTAGQFPERSYGADAMALAARFPGEVYPNLKTLLGLPIDDASVKEYAARHPALQLQAHSSRGTPAFKTKTLTAEEDALLVEELLAMELQSVQKNAEAAAGDGSSVRSIVLTVPPFYTIEEKRAVQLAADLAGLKVLSLVSDGLAVGLNYATSRQFPNINAGEKPEYHLVFDMGAGSTSASVMRFQSRTVKDVGKYNKTVQEVQVLGSGWDKTLGGDSLNYLIMDDMVSQFVESKGAQKISATVQGVTAHGRTMAKLAKEAERLRHVLSANQNTHASFEGLYEEVDFKYKLARADFESMAAAHAERIGVVISDAVKISGIELGDLTSIILHGGATRTPFVQKALEQAAGSADKIRSNVNSDEAAVFGAGFRAAELSPSFRVKEIRISEGPMYATGLKRASGEKRQRLWTAISPMGGSPKEMTFNDHQDFALTFYQQVGDVDKNVASLSTKNLTATVAALKEKYPSCVESEIVFKLGVKLRTENGEVQVVRAAMECEAEVTVKERIVDGVKNLFGFGKKDQKPLQGDDKNTESQESEGSKEILKEDAKSSTTSTTASDSTTASSSTESAAPSEEVREVKQKQIVSIPVEITLEKAGVPLLTKTELAKVKDRLKAFAASDKARFQREEALNQLEGYTYKIRDLLEGESFVGASTERERSELSKKASEIGDWLYEDGAEAAKEVFKAKLKTLQDIVVPIQSRIQEAENRPERIKTLKDSIKRITEYVDSIHKQISEYEEWQATSASASASGSSTTSASTESATSEFDGLEDDDAKDTKKKNEPEEPVGPIPPLFKKEELKELETVLKTTKDWLIEMEPKQEKLPITANPVLLVKDITEKIKKLDKVSLDLALKGAKSFGGKAKKAAKNIKKGKSKTGEDFEDFQGQRFTSEQLEEMLEKIKAMEKEKKPEKAGKEKEKTNGDKPGHDEL